MQIDFFFRNVIIAKFSLKVAENPEVDSTAEFLLVIMIHLSCEPQKNILMNSE